jgi:hypothetical protein
MHRHNFVQVDSQLDYFIISRGFLCKCGKRRRRYHLTPFGIITVIILGILVQFVALMLITFIKH